VAATRTRLDPQQRREQLLDLGVDQLAVRRLEELSIDTLAEVAGISRGLLYHYFSSKRDFHLAVLRRMADRVIAITAPVDGLPPLEQLVRSLEAFVDFVSSNHEAFVSFVRAAAAGDEEFHQIYEEARAALTDRIFEHAGAEGLAELGVVDSPAVRLMVRGWSASVEEVVLSWLDDDRGIEKRQLLEMLAASLPATSAVASAVVSAVASAVVSATR
jgi:AcrR family transcriptional regulator